MIQTQIQFFWPLTEQIPLDLDYGPSELLGECYNLNTDALTLTTWATNIAPQLTITPINSVGQLSIGGINVGMESKPKWYQIVLYKLMGFDWKNK
jgi:hypothetical protein